MNIYIVFVLLLSAVLLTPEEAFAYIGPGAGFAFLGSAFVFIITILMAFVTLVFWPVQWALRSFAGKKMSKNARTRRVVIAGLDGLDPKLVDKYMAEGKLPNLKALADSGSYRRLTSTIPPISPVAWSTFQTGVNPGAHNIFDFLTRDKRICLPQLSSTDTMAPKKKSLFGKLNLPFSKAKIRLLRKSRPFWKVLGKHGVFSTIIRVPISYPPEKFEGNILSAMCTPDLKGTQGSFTAYTSNGHANGAKHIGGQYKEVKIEANTIHSFLEGPPNPFAPTTKAPMKIPFSIELDKSKQEALLKIGKHKEVLKLNEFSSWITVSFKCTAFKTISGICRFCIREMDPEFFLYVSPINIDPEKPVLPIAHPIYYSSYLAKHQGPYGTLGLMEDTWGRNEMALDDQRFLDQAYSAHEERKEMFFNAIEKTNEGLCVCVFDASDRIQHMFWRYLEDDHPAPKEGEEFKNVIPELYQNMDKLVGETKAKLNDDDVLIVLSDHGFTSFKRCFNLNTWLYEQGYLAIKDGEDLETEYLQNVDWTKTKAFAVGLTGIFINRKGREQNGIVGDEEAELLKKEIAEKLEKLRDPQGDKKAVGKVYDAKKVYTGLYTDEAPDLVVGGVPGYRVSWESVTGGIEKEIFSDNLKAWSGDHDVPFVCVPGILLSNWEIKAKQPHIKDLAPTVLDLFDVPIPKYMEGQSVI